ncbi:hypothetical protein C1A50_3743 [Paenibacillus polymyxa]|nr:hypothetical protein C1A50_3743 [Paenibacillus polymyxa]
MVPSLHSDCFVPYPSLPMGDYFYYKMRKTIIHTIESKKDATLT